MKLLLFFSVSCAAFVLPQLESTLHDVQLVRRVDEQTVTNPDEERDYDYGTTGDAIPRSRVLTGLENQPAADRWFDWDESCTDPDQRQRVLGAFTNTMTLAKLASTQLEQLIKALPTVPGSSLNDANRKFIFEKDPAFAQMFLGHDHRLQYVKESFDLVVQNGQKFDGRGGNKPRALRFICNADNHVMNGGRSKPFCE